MANNPKPGFLAVAAIVKKHLGPLTYLFETHSGQHWRHHIDHLKSVGTNVSQASKDKSHADDIEIIPRA